MKIIFNFIASVFLIEVGFFLLFGNNINMNNMSKNLNNYQDDNIPAAGTEVELYIVDISEMFLENENYGGFMFDTDCYYIAQINDGRFIVIKTFGGSAIDEKVNEYSEKCRDYYYMKKGEKPPVLYLYGKIDTIPYLDNENYDDILEKGTRELMPTRGYVRMNLSDIIINVDYNVDGRSMDGVLRQSFKIMVSAANTLKKFLGVVVIFMGVVIVISFIRDILSGIVLGEQKNVIVAGDDVFKNISVMKKDIQYETNEIEFEKFTKNDNIHEIIKEKSDSETNKGFKLKKDD